MSEQNTAPEEEQNISAEQEDTAAEAAAPTYEELQAQVEELQGQLKDEQLRGLANEQNLRRRHQQEIADTHKFAGQKFAAECCRSKTISKWRCSTKAVISTR